MLVIILASLLGNAPAPSVTQPRAADPQQIAIETLTGTSPSTLSSQVTAQERTPTDPQAEIVNRITGRNVSYRAVSGHANESMGQLAPACAQSGERQGHTRQSRR